MSTLRPRCCLLSVRPHEFQWKFLSLLVVLGSWLLFFSTREAASGKEFLLVLHGSSAALKLLVGYFKPVHALNFTMGKSKYLPEDPPPLERPAQANASTVRI